MAETVIAIEQKLDALVKDLKQLGNWHTLDDQSIEQLRARRHLAKGETATQSDI